MLATIPIPWVPHPVDDPSRIEEISRLRATVWQATGVVAEDAFPNGHWRDAYDDDASHWFVVDPAGRLVAAARLTIHHQLADLPESFQYKQFAIAPHGTIAGPDHVVVCPLAQNHGIAARLLETQELAAIKAGARIAVRQASPKMVRLLVRRGWRMLGPALPDPRFPGATFTVAVKELPSWEVYRSIVNLARRSAS